MFEKITRWLPVLIPANRCDNLLKDVPVEKLLLLLSDSSSFHGVVRSLSSNKKKRVSRRMLPYLSREIAYRIDKKISSYLCARSVCLKNLSSAARRDGYVILHRYSWGQSLADKVRRQLWGRLGAQRREWINSEERSATDSFNTAKGFEELFVKGDSPLYEEVEVVSRSGVSGVIYRRIKGSESLK